MTAETVDCPACAGWGKFHLARCVINPGGRQYAHTVQSDATERSATVDGSPIEPPRSAQKPQTASVDMDALANADRACLCVIHLKDWRGGYGHTERQTNDNCPTHGDAA